MRFTDVSNLEVSFMARSNAYFLWPSVKDIQTIKKVGVLCTLTKPQKVTKRLFKISEDDAKKVQLLVNEYRD